MITLDDVQQDSTGHYTLKKGTSAPRTKWKNVKVWLSDGTPVQYHTVNGKRTRLDRPGDSVMDSIKERNWYLLLKGIEDTGRIHTLTRQVAFNILPTIRYQGEVLSKRRYTADFSFITQEAIVLANTINIEPHMTVIAEVKSKATQKETAYRLRRHLFIEKYIYPYQDTTRFVELF